MCIKKERNSRLRNKNGKIDSSNLSLVKIIDEWCCIETNSYPIRNEKILKRIKLEIKKFIYTNILYKTKVNFLLFNTFYNYKYKYDLKYVDEQYAFDVCAGVGVSNFYEVLKRHYKWIGNDQDKSGNIEYGLTENEHEERGNPREDFFHLGNIHSRDFQFSQLYTSIMYFCFLLLDRKYYLDFICLYLYIKSYFSLDKLLIKNETVLEFTCHEKFLNLLLKLSDITIYNSVNEMEADKENSFIQIGHTGRTNMKEEKKRKEQKNMYNLNEFEENIRIRNISTLSYNLLFRLQIKINFNELNYDLNANLYDTLCNFILSFQDEFTSKLISKLNEFNSLTFMCGKHIFMTSPSGREITNVNTHIDDIRNNEIFNNIHGNFHLWNTLPLRDQNAGLDINDTSIQTHDGNFNHLTHSKEHNMISLYQNKSIFTRFSNRIDAPQLRQQDMSFHESQQSIKEACYYNFSLFSANVNDAFLDEHRKSLFSFVHKGKASIGGEKVLVMDSIRGNYHMCGGKKLRENGWNCNTLNDSNECEVLMESTFTQRNNTSMGMLRPKEIFSFRGEDIYQDEEELDMKGGTVASYSCVKWRLEGKSIYSEWWKHLFNHLNVQGDSDRSNDSANDSAKNCFNSCSNNIGKNSERKDNQRLGRYLWNKSYTNDTSALKKIEREILKKRKKGKYQRNFLSIINSIYVTLHKNIIYSINNRIEEYRFFIMKRFFHLVFNNNNSKQNQNMINTWKYQIMACLLGHESDMFSVHHKTKYSTTIAINTTTSRATAGGTTTETRDGRRVREMKRSKAFTKQNGSITLKEKLKKLKRGDIYISKNVICVNHEIVFWKKKKNEKLLRLHFKPFQNYFSSPFYQKYIHLFFYFSKIGTIVRYIKLFVRVFSKIMFHKGSKKKHITKSRVKNPGAVWSNEKNITMDVKCWGEQNAETQNSLFKKRINRISKVSKVSSISRTRSMSKVSSMSRINKTGKEKKTNEPKENVKKKKEMHNCWTQPDYDVIPLGEVFITFVNAVANYMHFYDENIRKIIIHECLSTPLEIYNTVKSHLECIEFLAFLCSSYASDKHEILKKKFFPFYELQTSTNTTTANVEEEGGENGISNEKQIIEYNYFLNIIYGLSHEHYCKEAQVHGLKTITTAESNNIFSNASIRDLSHGYDKNLFIFPRGSELLSYVYKYYYLFVSVRKTNLENLCRYIFLKIIKPLLHFLYAYVYLGINKDYHFEYMICKEVAHQFFFVFQNGTRYYNREFLMSDTFLSLPVFLKYFIEMTYDAGLLSRILRASSEEDFYMAIPKVGNVENLRNLENERKRKKKREGIEKTSNQRVYLNGTSISKLLCTSSIMNIENFLNLYTNLHQQNVRRKNENFVNVFIEHWNNEEYSKLVFTKTKRKIDKRLQKYFFTFLKTLNEHNVLQTPQGRNSDDGNSAGCSASYSDYNEKSKFLKKNNAEESMKKNHNDPNRCRFVGFNKLSIICKRRNKQKRNFNMSSFRNEAAALRSCHQKQQKKKMEKMEMEKMEKMKMEKMEKMKMEKMEKMKMEKMEKMNILGHTVRCTDERVSSRQGTPAATTDRFKKTFMQSMKSMEAWQMGKKHNLKLKKHSHDESSPTSSSNSGSEDTLYTSFDNTTASSLHTHLSTRHYYGKAWKKKNGNLKYIKRHDQVGFTQNEIKMNEESRCVLNPFEHTLFGKDENNYDRRELLRFCINYKGHKDNISSVVYVKRATRGYKKWRNSEKSRNFTISRSNEFCNDDEREQMAVGEEMGMEEDQEKFEIKSINYFIYRNIYIPIKNHYDNINKILVYCFLIKKNLLPFLCLLKCYLFDEKEENYKTLSLLLCGKKSDNSYNCLRSYNIHQNNTHTTKNVQTHFWQKKLLHYHLDKDFFTSTDISTMFNYIDIRIQIPHMLRIFFDERVINCYRSVYKLTSLLYFTHQSLNHIFWIFCKLTKPLVYQYKQETEAVGGSTFFRSQDFKYIHLINDIANGMGSGENSDEEKIERGVMNSAGDVPRRASDVNLNCSLTRKICSVFLTNGRFFNIGLDKHFRCNRNVNKFMENAKILNDILNDFNKIRNEMHLIVRYIYDYVMNMNIYRNYFFFFQNVLKISSFSYLIEFHKSLVEHIFNFSFLSSHFLSLRKTIFTIINLVNVFKRIMDSFISYESDTQQELVNFSRTFDQHSKALEKNIILLTSPDAQTFIKNFYINRNHLIMHIREFQNGRLGCIYNTFFFNQYYSLMFEEI
ncbi:hypothetical protein, conserved [Plasmodium gonderi]|uniref:Uncharacterized protein n=1 Tax=Plasmodium gonderi TaxID=77519 RepID=A0A1Y1JDR7_PLAGO|nr:hypothetical protein, conserved [Plasmodium gonderi]GAW80661.1 hypothetical protein, conserved [Plasmodium gonderi]